MQVLGGYSLISPVGVGSTGTVWRAVQIDLGRPAAVKVLLPGADRNLLRGEARILASLDHPNIVKVYDFVEAEQNSPQAPSWIAEEWVDGERLDELLNRLDHRLTPEQGLGVTRGALQGLAHAHDRGVVHGDVSAGNVLVDLSGTSKLIDFGLASPVGSTTSSGTPAFISPEAARGLPLTPASDVYSAASVLYYLLDGQPPFGADRGDTLIDRHISAPPPRLNDHGDHLADLIQRAMAKDPGERPPNAAALLAELEEAARERYGPAWLVRASVAGLAAAPAAAAAIGEAVTAGAPAAAEEVGTTIIAGAATSTDVPVTLPASNDAARAIPKAAKRSWKPTVAAAGGVAVVAVVAGVIVGVAATSGGGKKEPVAAVVPAVSSPPASPTPTASPTPAAPPAVTLSQSLVGKLTVTFTVAASNDPDRPVGTSTTRTWTIASACSAVPCRLAIESSSGRKYVGVLNDGKITISDKGTHAGQCVDQVTGQVQPNRPVSIDVANYYVIIVKRTPTGLITLSGSGLGSTVVGANPTNCPPFPPENVTETITGKQLQ